MSESALIVTYSEKSAAFFAELLGVSSVSDTVIAPSCGEARRLILERDFDFVIINAPLPDESGESLARQIAVKGVSQVILVVKNEIFDLVSAVCEGDGVLTVSKPLSREMFWSALSFTKSVRARLMRAQNENERLKQKIENIKLADRTKCILISAAGMTEQEAHRYIERQAMDTRSTKRAVCERIINDYENGTKD